MRRELSVATLDSEPANGVPNQNQPLISCVNQFSYGTPVDLHGPFSKFLAASRVVYQPLTEQALQNPSLSQSVWAVMRGSKLLIQVAVNFLIAHL
jgi:hypothetical protein